MVEQLLVSATQKEAVERYERAYGKQIARSQVSRWLRLPTFLRAYKAREAELAGGVTREGVIKNARIVFEEAMEPQPIVSRRSGEVVGYERQLGAALTANEQMGKAVGAFNQDKQGREIIVIDIDFSGRKAPVEERRFVDGQEVIEGEFTETGPSVQEIEPSIISEQPPKVDSAWLD